MSSRARSEARFGARGDVSRLYLAISICGFVASCDCAPAPASFEDAGERPPPAVADAGPSREERCARELEALAQDGALQTEMARYYEDVPITVLKAKIVPAIYLRRPVRATDPKAVAIRESLSSAARVEAAIEKIVDEHSNDRPLLRQVFLSENYLFEDDPKIAVAVVKAVELDDLFDEPEIHLLRGGVVSSLHRDRGGYVDAAGDRVAILLNDRVAVSAKELAEPLHLDLDQLRADTGALRVIPERISAFASAVRLVFPNGFTTDALVELEGERAKVRCTAKSEDLMAQATERARGFWLWVDDVARAAQAMVEERPGFDEPTDEAQGEQEDGKLRAQWVEAYHRRERRFSYREQEYRVFDRRGNPTPPQVCIDFIFDTWERSSGNWYRKRTARPGRTRGYLDFGLLPGLVKRYTPSVLEFAANNGGLIERYDLPRADWVPYGRGDDFARAIARNADHLREGDAIVIHGLRDEDMEEHYHTALILRTDPLSGMPMIVADNAGRPRIRNLASAMRSAPKRAVKHRLRVNPIWLDETRAAFISSEAR